MTIVSLTILAPSMMIRVIKASSRDSVAADTADSKRRHMHRDGNGLNLDTSHSFDQVRVSEEVRINEEVRVRVSEEVRVRVSDQATILLPSILRRLQ